MDFTQILPDELSTHIFGYLNCRELYNCMQICSNWGEIIQNSQEVWHQVCLRDFDIELQRMKRLDVDIGEGQMNWVRVCRMCIESRRNAPMEVLSLREALPAICKDLSRRITIYDGGLRSCGAIISASVAAALAINSTLTALDMTQCGLGVNDVATLVKALRSRKIWLMSLTLSENAVGDEGATLVSSLIDDEEWPVEVAMRRSGLTEEGVTSLLSSAFTSSKLRSLDVSQNVIDQEPESLREAFSYVSSSSSLHTLKMDEMNISDSHLGFTEFTRMAKGNLEMLTFRNNFITSEGANYIAELLQHSLSEGKGMRYLDVSGNWIGNEGYLNILRVLIAFRGSNLEEKVPEDEEFEIARAVRYVSGLRYSERRIERGELLINTEANAIQCSDDIPKTK